MDIFNNFPPQKVSYKKKGREGRTKCIDGADNNFLLHNSYTRKSHKNKIINYNLVNGILDMSDVASVINPYDIVSSFSPEKIQHYPLINSKLNILKGEEWSRRFDYRVIVTNPDAISEIDESKKAALIQNLESGFTSDAQSEEEAERELEKVADYYKYTGRDMREMRASYLMKHYERELDFGLKFNAGLMDAMICGEEIYQCDIVGGEPTMERLNPKKLLVVRSGFSNKIEDADMILYWDYGSPGKIQDTFYDVLTNDDIKKIEKLSSQFSTDEMGNFDETKRYVFIDPLGETSGEGAIFEGNLGLFNANSGNYGGNNPVDMLGNIRVLRLYGKSYRQIKKVKSYDPETGEEIYNFYPEDYIIDKDMGEEEEILYINEAWEGTKIGKDMYVNMRPRIVQYNRISNPSRCHFGIVGSIYNLNESKPYSFVDMMKWFNYLYDVVSDNLLKMMATNWGKIMRIDLASAPAGGEMDKLLYFAKVNRVKIEDSFKEGNKGAAMGKLAGFMNNNSSGVIDADNSQAIEFYMNFLEGLKQSMSEMIGITKQREGAISNRETVGGVERSVLQSSHITEWLFMTHDNVKKRTYECFIETAKAAMKGKSVKFQHILSDGTSKIMEIDGDEFAECDYGITVDNSKYSLELIQKLEGLAQSMVQNQLISASTLIKIFSDASVAEITRTIQEEERNTLQRQSEQAEADREMQMQQAQMQMQMEQDKVRIVEDNNIRDNETKLIIAGMKAEFDSIGNVEEESFDPQRKAELEENMRQFDQKISLDKDKFSWEKSKGKEELRLKEKAINKKPIKTSS